MEPGWRPSAARDGRNALRVSTHVDMILMDDVTDSETTIQWCSVALGAWEAVKASAGSAFSTSNCSLRPGRRRGVVLGASA